ncbi:hypothetical protein [Primorskyibacter flagellatus]|uniref:hypothetical protein n=1 Tax=Primorskyibacter flagellatus TaxID=1387277 RepID=UPI003A8D1853
MKAPSSQILIVVDARDIGEPLGQYLGKPMMEATPRARLDHRCQSAQKKPCQFATKDT